MSQYTIAPAAWGDLQEIWDYLAGEASVETADRVYDELHSAMKRLAEWPGLGHLREDLCDEPLRFYRVFSYLILYRPETKPLGIVRVLHAAMDIRSILRGG
jgi:plasmid stabilization system protein ParE